MTTSEATMNLPLWRWTTEDGEPQTGSERELVQQLASGELAPYALVWRDGWGEWLPALEVAELAVAFPEIPLGSPRRARPSTVPGIPPVPVSEYPRVRLLAKGARTSTSGLHPSPLHSAALHSAALHSPARVGVAVPFDTSEREVITSEVPLDALLEAARVMTDASPPADLGLDAAIERASAYPQPYRFDSETPRSGPVSRPALPLAAEFGLQGLLEEARPQPSRWPPWLRAHGLWITLGAIALALLALFGARWLVALSLASKAAAASRAASDAVASNGLESGALGTSQGAPGGRMLSASDHGVTPLQPRPLGSPAARGVPGVGCSVRQAPVKLDDWAVVDVRPSLLGLPGGRKVAIGYAQSHKQATGGTLDIATLDFDRRFGQQQERQIFSVTPLGASGRVGYQVERMGALVAFGRALDVLPPLRVGMNDAGLVAGPIDERSEKVWELPLGTMISVPEIVGHAQGFTLATRTGKATTGLLRVGLLSARGTALSPLAQLGDADSEFGRPALASGVEQTVLAATLRSDPERSPALLLARAPNGQLPLDLQPVDIASEPDVEVAAPALAALPDGGFALMWSQGGSSRRQVRVLRLSSNLVPIGDPSEIALPELAPGGATAGALYWAGDRLLAFFFLRRGEGNSLWVSSLGCGV